MCLDASLNSLTVALLTELHPSNDNTTARAGTRNGEARVVMRFRENYAMRSRSNDLMRFMAALGLCTGTAIGSVLHVDDDAPPAGLCPGDTDHDGDVDTADLITLILNWTWT